MSLPSPSQEKHQSFIAENSIHEQIPQGFDFDPADVAVHAPSLRGRKLTAAAAFVAGTGFTLFGCVQGVTCLISSIKFTTCFDFQI
jgi:hypothetical protein